MAGDATDAARCQILLVRTNISSTTCKGFVLKGCMSGCARVILYNHFNPMLRAHQSSGSRSLKHLSFPPVLRNAEAVRSPDDPVSQLHLCGTSRPCHRLRAAACVEPTRSLPEPSQTQTQDWARTCRRPPKSCARELLILGILGSATHISHACTVEKQVLSTFFSRQNRHKLFTANC